MAIAPTQSVSTTIFRQPWIGSAAVDLPFILLPPFLVTALVLLFQGRLESTNPLPAWFWVATILCVDVAHVYSTLFRTYLNPQAFQRQKNLFTLVPAACWLVGALLYTLDGLLFWRVLAYLAVFHFVRQQYGFMRLYIRHEPPLFRQAQWLDTAVIYLTMLYPLAFWHTHLPRNFTWFIEHDFLAMLPAFADKLVLGLYGLMLVAYAFKEGLFSLKTHSINLPKNLLILGTALSWGVGIVLLNSDLAFTATNVISHGVPYMALIWIYGRRVARQTPNQPISGGLNHRFVFSLTSIPLFILFLWALAYLEEGLWDGLIWREHAEIFPAFGFLPHITAPDTLAWLVPLLTLPQATHYILDGYIWRMKHPDISWKSVLQDSDLASAPSPESFSSRCTVR